MTPSKSPPSIARHFVVTFSVVTLSVVGLTEPDHVFPKLAALHPKRRIHPLEFIPNFLPTRAIKQNPQRFPCLNAAVGGPALRGSQIFFDADSAPRFVGVADYVAISQIRILGDAVSYTHLTLPTIYPV